VKWTGIAIYRFADDKIQEIRGWNDALGLMRQLEAISPLGKGGKE